MAYNISHNSLDEDKTKTYVLPGVYDTPIAFREDTPMSIVNKYHEEMLKHDPVNKPAHYNNGGIECIDYIEQTLGKEGFKAYCIGNCVKYLHRHEYKGKPEEDLRKAAYYLNKAISTYGDK